MTPIPVALCVTSLALAFPIHAASVSNARVEGLPKSLEVRLALSAAPAYLRAGAAVYVLDPASGYRLERSGTNGFTCYVQRTDYTREDFNDGYIVPECQGPEGGKTIVPVEFDIEQLRASGAMGPHELKLEIERRFKTGIYHAPSHPGIAYMLSPVLGLYAGRSKTTTVMNMPHFMFYAPNLTKEEFGTGPIMGSYPYLINSGPMAYIILHAGAAEKAAINEAEADLLTAVCEYRASLCIRGVTPDFSTTSGNVPQPPPRRIASAARLKRTTFTLQGVLR